MAEREPDRRTKIREAMRQKAMDQGRRRATTNVPPAGHGPLARSVEPTQRVETVEGIDSLDQALETREDATGEGGVLRRPVNKQESRRASDQAAGSSANRLTHAQLVAEIDLAVATMAALISRIRDPRTAAKETIEQAFNTYIARHRDRPQTYTEKKMFAEVVSAYLAESNHVILYQDQRCYLSVSKDDEHPDGRFLIVPFGSKKPLLTTVHSSRLPALKFSDGGSQRERPAEGASVDTFAEREHIRRASKKITTPENEK